MVLGRNVKFSKERWKRVKIEIPEINIKLKNSAHLIRMTTEILKHQLSNMPIFIKMLSKFRVKMNKNRINFLSVSLQIIYFACVSMHYCSFLFKKSNLNVLFEAKECTFSPFLSLVTKIWKCLVPELFNMQAIYLH